MFVNMVMLEILKALLVVLKAIPASMSIKAIFAMRSYRKTKINYFIKITKIIGKLFGYTI